MVLKQFVVFDANRVDIPFAYYIVQASFQSWYPQTSAWLRWALVPSSVCTLELPGWGEGGDLEFQTLRPYPKLTASKRSRYWYFFKAPQVIIGAARIQNYWSREYINNSIISVL